MNGKTGACFTISYGIGELLTETYYKPLAQKYPGDKVATQHTSGQKS